MTDLMIGLRQLDEAGAAVNPATAEGQLRHETHAMTNEVVTVETTAAPIATLLGYVVPSWVTACRLYPGKTGRIAYSCDGTDPAFVDGDQTHGAPVDAFYPGHLIPGAASVAALRLVAETGDTAVTIELIG